FYLRGVLRAFLFRLRGRLRAAAAFRAARLRQAAAQPLHQIDHFGLTRFLRGLERRFLALRLALDDPQQVLAVLIGVLRGIPVGGEAVDERLRHVEFGLA